MESEKTMGRPKKSEDNKKTESVVCYLKKSELASLKFLANKTDLTYSNYLRKIFLEHIKNH